MERFPNGVAIADSSGLLLALRPAGDERGEGTGELFASASNWVCDAQRAGGARVTWQCRRRRGCRGHGSFLRLEMLLGKGSAAIPCGPYN